MLQSAMGLCSRKTSVSIKLHKKAYSSLLWLRMESNFDVSSGCFTKFKWRDERHCKQVDENTGVWLICGSRWEKPSWQKQDYSQCHASSTRLSTGPERGWRGQLLNWWCIDFIPIFNKGELSSKKIVVIFILWHDIFSYPDVFLIISIQF